jgi:hypothetical protein
MPAINMFASIKNRFILQSHQECTESTNGDGAKINCH